MPGEARATEFAYSIETDGTSVSVQFETRRREQYPSSRREINMLPRRPDLSQCRRGITHLNKEPQGLTVERLEQSRLIGIGPGLRSMLTAVDTDHQNRGNRDQHRGHIVSMPSGEYQ